MRLVALSLVLAACGAPAGNPANDLGSGSSPDLGSTNPNDPSDPTTPTGPEKVPPAPVYDDVGIMVSPSGSDTTGDGTEAHPYQTIGHVLAAVAKPGDTIILRAGEYREEVRIRIPRITIRSHSGEWGLISQPITMDGNNALMPVMFDVDSDGSKLQRVEVKGGFYAIFLQTKWDWGEADRSGALDITIEDSKIHDSGRDCIKVTPGSDRVTIRRTEIFNSGMAYPPGETDKNAEGIDLVNADDALIQDCYVHDTATTGIYLKGGARRGVIERTRVERAGSMGIALGFDTSPEYFDLTENPGYYENLDGVVRNCVVEGAQYAGIALYASLNAKVLNNTIIDTAREAHAPIYFGVTFQDYDPDAKRPANRAPTVVNNLVSQPRAGSCVAIRYSDELGGLSGLSGPATLDNNLYWAAGGACTFEDGRAPGLDGAALAAWRTHVGGEANSIAADPRLATGGKLQAGSAAIDKGAVRTEVSLDIDGRPRTAPVDIGADEYGN